MRQSLRITFRGMTSSPTVEGRIRELADRLNDVFEGIVGCHVVVEEETTKHRHGNPFRARVDLSVPGKAIVGESQKVERENARSVNDALQSAFDRAERQLLHYRDQLRSHRA